MNRSSFALFVALLIHILLLLIFWVLGSLMPEIEKQPQKEDKKIKISLKEMPKKYKKSGDTKRKVESSQIAPPMPKGSQLKEIVKPLQKYRPEIKPLKPKLNPKPKPKTEPKVVKPKPKTEPLPPKKPYIVLREDNTTKKEVKKPIDKLYAMLLQDKSSTKDKIKENKNQLRLGAGGTTKEMKKLYGSKWGKLTPGQQKYMLDNQEIMRRITQEVLTRVARVNLSRDLNVNRSNVIEFYLHPNGDMSDFKFLRNSGYHVLDDTTKETIEYAYSRYPRPNEKVLVRYNVFYNLAGH